MTDVITAGQVGPQTLSDGVVGSRIRQGRGAEQIFSELHGKYYEASYRGNLFWATMTAGVIFPAPGATAANPVSLYNPLGSGKNLVLVSFDMVLTIIPGTPLTGLYGLYINNLPQAAAVTGTTLAAQSGLIGGTAASAGKALTTSTVPAAPTLFLPFGGKVTGEVAAVVPITGLPAYHIDFDGRAILAPGTAITPQQTVADTTNATVLCAWAWEEVSV